MEKKGFFITFEGPEGAGKSSHADALAAGLTARGFKCVRTREPGGTPLAEQLRTVVKSHHGNEILHPETELLLMEAARAQHMRQLILPALNENCVVICDRFYDSTTAYQGGARGLAKEDISRFNDFAAAGRHPDLTILLDLSPEKGFERIRNRNADNGAYDRFEVEKIDFHKKVRNAFLDIAKSDPERVKVVNADRPKEIVFSEIERFVNELVH